MMSDEERRRLALKIIDGVLARFAEPDSPDQTPLLFGIEKEPGGENAPLYAGSSPKGYGSFFCEYTALAAVESLIRQCEAQYDQTAGRAEMEVLGRADEARRLKTVYLAAELAARLLLTQMRAALCDAVDDTFNAASLMASAVMLQLENDTFPAEKKITFDARAKIKTEAQAVADRYKKKLRWMLSLLPNMIAEGQRGPKAKVNLDSIRKARDKVRADGNGKPTVLDIVAEFDFRGVQVDETTIYRHLDGRALDDL